MITKEQAEFLRERLKECYIKTDDEYTQKGHCGANHSLLRTCIDTCPIFGVCIDKGAYSKSVIEKLLVEYEAQEEEMSENKEIMFQNRTRGGFDYIIYTREGKDEDSPIVGAYLNNNGKWITCGWYQEGNCLPSKTHDERDLIPVKSLPLEGKKVGENIYAYDEKMTDIDKVTEFLITQEHSDGGFWITFGLTKIAIDFNGEAIGFGNGKQLFFPTEEEARKSVGVDKNENK